MSFQIKIHSIIKNYYIHPFLTCILLVFSISCIFSSGFGQSEEVERLFFSSSIKQGKIIGQKSEVRVTEGRQVELQWVSDKDLELHLHGYDIVLKLKKNIPSSLKFVAITPGRFPLTIHNSGGHGQSAIFYIEVYPN